MVSVRTPNCNEDDLQYLGKLCRETWPKKGERVTSSTFAPSDREKELFNSIWRKYPKELVVLAINEHKLNTNAKGFPVRVDEMESIIRRQIVNESNGETDDICRCPICVHRAVWGRLELTVDETKREAWRLFRRKHPKIAPISAINELWRIDRWHCPKEGERKPYVPFDEFVKSRASVMKKLEAAHGETAA